MMPLWALSSVQLGLVSEHELAQRRRKRRMPLSGGRTGCCDSDASNISVLGAAAACPIPEWFSPE